MKFRQKARVQARSSRKGKCNVWKNKMAPTEDTDFNTSTKNSRQKAFEVNLKSVHASCRSMGHWSEKYFCYETIDIVVSTMVSDGSINLLLTEQNYFCSQFYALFFIQVYNYQHS